MATQIDQRSFDLEEQIVRIRKIVDESDKLRAEAAKMQRETRFLPWQFMVAGLTTGGGLVLASIALATFFIGGKG